MRVVDYFGLILVFETIFLLGYHFGRKESGRE